MCSRVSCFPRYVWKPQRVFVELLFTSPQTIRRTRFTRCVVIEFHLLINWSSAPIKRVSLLNPVIFAQKPRCMAIIKLCVQMIRRKKFRYAGIITIYQKIKYKIKIFTKETSNTFKITAIDRVKIYVFQLIYFVNV